MNQLPTTEEVTHLYLYGTAIVPLNMRAETLIRANTVISARVTLDDYLMASHVAKKTRYAVNDSTWKVAT